MNSIPENLEERLSIIEDKISTIEELLIVRRTKHMTNPSDKVISLEKLQAIINVLGNLPYKNVHTVIQTLLSLEDVNKVNNKDKVESK